LNEVSPEQMNVTAMSEWESFYVIVGSSAGALIGLQFVVITIIADRPRLRVAEAGAAFSTPSVVHFGVVLLLSAIVSAPWNGIAIPAVLCGLFGFCGIAYVGVVLRRMRAQTVYRPVFEDWLLHVLLPLAAYAILAVSACVAGWRARPALFGIGTAALLLLFVGIHNAWDAITYHVFVQRREEPESDSSGSGTKSK
jgi:hypothetical protein